MPKCVREEYTGNAGKHFSTQIGYSNYPRLFNLAARLQALFQVPSAKRESNTQFVLGVLRRGGGWAGIFLCVTSFLSATRGPWICCERACRAGGGCEFRADPLLPLR